MTLTDLIREYKGIHVHVAAHADGFEPEVHERLDAVVAELRSRGLLDD